MTNSTAHSPTSSGLVRIGTIAAIPRVLEQLGFSSAGVLADIGFDPSLFDDPNRVITLGTRSHLIQQCVKKTHCPYFGLLIGQQTGLSAFGLLGFFVQQSPDVSTALQSLMQYAYLHVRGAGINFETRDDWAFLGYSIFLPNIEAREQVEGGAVAIAYNIMRRLAGPEWSAESVSFAYRRPENVRPYQHFFKAPLTFDAERNGVFFAARWLDQPVPGAEPELRRILQTQIDQMDDLAGDSFIEQVERALQSALLTEKSSAKDIAAMFSIHPRTLNRRLEAYGTNFRQLVEQARFEIAQHFLENMSLDIIWIASAMNYADATAFSRAFKRWSGMTPTCWRRETRLAVSNAARTDDA